MKKILGLDLGTNSIGWALIEQNFTKKEGRILGMGSRIIPMDAKELSNFSNGQTVSATADRTAARSMRRLYQRDNLRRERLHRVLNILGFLPEHYAKDIDFEKYFGQFRKGTEPKLAYRAADDGKHHFIFKKSFQEMVEAFKAAGQNVKIPHDWTIYYLRKKALSQKISKEELAWVLLNFNQKRGYYQARGEEDEFDASKDKQFVVLTVAEVKDSGEEVKGKKLYDVIFDNGWEYDKQVVKTENWIGKTKEFIVTIKELKNGTIKRTFKEVDSEKDWIAIKEKTQDEIRKSGKTVGDYIFHSLLERPDQKIRGKLVKTIEREFYREELERILDAQIKLHTELQDDELYAQCVQELYKHNESHKANILDRDFNYLFIEDIIFYHRPLKSKKSTISNCPFESRMYKKDGEEIEVPIKCISKSHPLYQEFRLWQFIHNLRIYQREAEENGKPVFDKDVSSQFLKEEEDYVELYRFLNQRKEISQKALLKHYKLDEKSHRWNYVEEKNYPCNELRAEIKTRLNKLDGVKAEEYLTGDFITNLWHIIYSVRDRKQYNSALETFAEKQGFETEAFKEAFIKMNPFDSDYGGYSEKALKKLLPLMRRGKYWDKEAIPEDAKSRIADIMERLDDIGRDKEKIEKVSDDDIPKPVLKSFAKVSDAHKGLNTYQASYAVYGRHAELSEITRWTTPQNITDYLNPKVEGGFRQHSLRNPIVEQVVTETLRLVRDIWKHEKYGNGKLGYFDEIHVELGRDMKNSSKVREKMTKTINQNTDTNERIKNILQEMMEDSDIEGDVRPYSKGHQEILKLYEEGVYATSGESYRGIAKKEIEDVRKKSSPSKKEITRYKLWLQQGYVSPYTGDTIPLNRLFTSEYEVEHIIPRSRYFDDSLSNKVICESAINPYPYKGSRTAYQFIREMGGSIVPELSLNGKSVRILKLEEYEARCKKHFGENKKKLEFLLSDEVPEGFINRQLNDSRYISKVVKGLLSNVVREENEKDATSKHLVPVVGKITSQLKRDWGLNDVWDELLTPRFERMNKLTDSTDFRFETEDGHGNRYMINTVPDELAKGFSKKRLDHRHHALDALVVACTTKDHTNLLGNKHANSKNKRYDLKHKLSFKTKPDASGNYRWQFYSPWENFTVDAKKVLETTVVSFKQNKRVINKATNKYYKWKMEDGKMKKVLVEQKGSNWAIRKAMHDPMPYGEVKMPFDVLDIHNSVGRRSEIMDEKIRDQVEEVFGQFGTVGKAQSHLKKNPVENAYGYPVSKARFKIANTKYAKRQPFEKLTAGSLSTVVNKIDEKGIEHPESQKAIVKATEEVQKQIWKVQDLQLQLDLEEHLYQNLSTNRIPIALFSSEGVEDFNKNRLKKNRKPVKNLRFAESGEKRFALGDSQDTRHKMMETTEGGNMYFNIYWDEKGQKRNYETVPLNEVIKHQKSVTSIKKDERTEAPLNPDLGRFLFSLSPEDLVYVPTDEEMEDPSSVDFQNLSKSQHERIYKMVSTTQNKLQCQPFCYATEIKKNENGSSNKTERILDYPNSQSVLDEKEDFVMIKSRCWKLRYDRLGNLSIAV